MILCRTGGILNQARLTLVDVTIRDSRAQGLPGADGDADTDGTDGGHGYGGGVYNGCVSGGCGTLIMTDTLIKGNAAGGGTGGRVPEESGRQAGDGGDAYGGGIYNDCAGPICGTISGTRVAILSNRAEGGDAGCADDPSGITADAGAGAAVCDMGAYEGVVPPTDFVFFPCILRP